MSSSRVVLVTGVSGFLGRYVAREFFEHGWTVVGTARQPRPIELDTCVAHYYSIVLAGSVLDDIIAQHPPDVCIHCAGGSSVEASVRDPHGDFEAGPLVTSALLDALRRLAPRCRVVFLSSAAVYGDPDVLPIAETQPPRPISPYGFHKLQCEQLCIEYTRVYALQTSIARIFSALGPGLRKQVCWDICRRAVSEPRLSLRGTGTESRDFIHATDIAAGLRIIAESGAMSGEVYNLASGEELRIAELAALLLQSLDRQCVIEFDGSAPEGTPKNWRADIRKLSALGFIPRISANAGLEAFAVWARSELR